MTRLDGAINLHIEGDLDAAATIYLDILAAEPDEPTALHYLGVLAHQRGESQAGIRLIERSIELNPANSDWLNDLGNVLVGVDRFNEAATAFQAAIGLKPGDPNLWNNLGAAFLRAARLQEAQQAFLQAVELAPQFVAALSNLGDLLTQLDRIEDAAQYYCRAFIEPPHDGKSKYMLGAAYYSLNRISDAAAVYQDWLRDDPASPIAAHLLAACSGQNVPTRASDGFIELTFDQYAETFDERLVLSLNYGGPALIGDALAAAAAPNTALTTLDAGCGTGLCGSVLAPYSGRLVGIDLSSRMLNKAAARNVYDSLEKAEISTYLNSHSDNFDLIICADVLNYFGDLGPVIAAAKRALKSFGLLIFTFEAAHEPDVSSEYLLKPSGRYGHSLGYVKDILAFHRLNLARIRAAVIREEFKKPVSGYVVTARNPSRWRHSNSSH